MALELAGNNAAIVFLVEKLTLSCHVKALVKLIGDRPISY